MSKKFFSNTLAASAALLLTVATLVASPTPGNCRMQYAHCDEIVAPPVTTTPLVAAGATLSAALLAVGVGKHLAAKKGL